MTNKIKIIKSSFISLFCFLLALLFWYMLNNLFLWREGNVISDLIFAFVSFSVFFIFSMMYLLLVDNRIIIMISSFFIIFSSLIFFLRRDGTWVGIVAIISYIASTLILFVVYNLTNKNIIYDRKNSIVFHARKSILKAGPMLLIIFALLISVIFYFNFPLLNSEGDIVIEEPIVEKTTRPFGDIINSFIPIYDLDMSVNEFIVLTYVLGLPFAQQEGEELQPPVNMEEPPQEIIDYLTSKGIYNLGEVNITEYLQQDEEFRTMFLEALKEQTSEADLNLMYEYRKNLSENWGIKISSYDRMGEVFTRLINSKINQIPEKIKKLILIFPAIILFGVLQISFIILNYIYAFISWAILIIFYKSKFYHIKKVEIQKEEIEL